MNSYCNTPKFIFLLDTPIFTMAWENVRLTLEALNRYTKTGSIEMSLHLFASIERQKSGMVNSRFLHI